MLAMNSSYRISTAILALLLVSGAVARTQVLHVTVIDSAHGISVSDTTVTVNGAVLAPDASGGYTIPPKTQSIMLRAPGYRAASYSPTEAAKRHGQLPLTAFTVKALFLTEYGIASRALRDPALDIIHRGKANALVINIKSDHGLLD